MTLRQDLIVLTQYLATAWNDPLLRADVEKELERLREEEND